MGCFLYVLQFTVDIFSLQHTLYEVHNVVISIWGSSFFFTFGPVVVVAVLISQFQPTKRWASIINVVAFKVIYLLEELLLVLRNAVVYINWNYGASIGVNALIMMSLSWFSIIVLKRGVKGN